MAENQVSYGSWFPTPDTKTKKSTKRTLVQSVSIWACLSVTALLLITTLVYACWDGVLPYLFHFPTLSWLNSLSLVGLVLMSFGALWAGIWLIYASMKQTSE